MRTFLFAVVLVGAFVYVTTRPGSVVRRVLEGDNGPLWSGPSVTHSAGLGSDELNNIDIYKSAHNSVVYITSTVYQRTFFFDVVPAKELGSGFIVNPEGQILTNFHVISGSAQVEVTTPEDQARYKAEVLFRDRQNDLALIKIAPRKRLPSLTLGDSDHLQVGQKVLAIGNPFGLAGTLTVGVISTLDRPIETENSKMEGMIQTDAAINSGNSGGPLLDSSGNVIGINTAIYGPNGGNVGIGFALPINRAKNMLDDFRAGRKPARLGISTVLISGDLAEELSLPTKGGLLIQEVQRGSAAESAGLRGYNRVVLVGNSRLGVGGDFITAIDGKPVTEQDDVSRAISRKHAGDVMELTIVRGGRTMTLKVTLGAMGDEV